MFESKFSFIGKIFLLAFLFINLPSFFPINIFEVSYFLFFTTTIFDTASLLVLSLSISKFIHVKNLKLLEELNNKDNENSNLSERINEFICQVKNDNKLLFFSVIFFAIITLIQPFILVFTLDKSDIYASSVISSINKQFNSQKKELEVLISKKDSDNINDINIRNFEDRIFNLSKIKDENIEQFLKSNNKNKFENVKVIIRNFFLGLLWILCFYKIYKI